MPVLTVSLSRESLDLSPLVITNDPGADRFWLGDAPHGWPDVAAVIRRQVPRPRNAEPISLVEVPLAIYVTAHSSAGLFAARSLLTAVTTQRDYEVTLTRSSGSSKTWQAGPTWPIWTGIPAQLGTKTAVANLRLPLRQLVPARAVPAYAALAR